MYKKLRPILTALLITSAIQHTFAADNFPVFEQQAQQILHQPLIEQIKWGEITVVNNGSTITYRDAKLWPNHSREWDWKETGTRHNPGI